MGLEKSNEDGVWVHMTPVDVGVEREKKGYAVLQDDTIPCADCGLELVEIIKVQENDVVKYVKVVCPCSGSSFIFQVQGKTYIQAVEGLTIEDMSMDLDDDGSMHVIVKVIE